MYRSEWRKRVRSQRQERARRRCSREGRGGLARWRETGEAEDGRSDSHQARVGATSKGTDFSFARWRTGHLRATHELLLYTYFTFCTPSRSLSLNIRRSVIPFRRATPRGRNRGNEYGVVGNFVESCAYVLSQFHQFACVNVGIQLYE